MRVIFTILAISLLTLGCNKTESQSTEQESPNAAAANANSEEAAPEGEESEAPASNEEEAEGTENAEEGATENAEEGATENAEEGAAENAEEGAAENAEEGATENAEETTTASAAQPGAATPEQQAEEAGCVYKQAIADSESADGEAAPVPNGCAQVVDSTPSSTEGDVNHYGSDFTLTETQSIDAVIAKASELSGQNVRVEATISKVCLRKGCWFVLQGTENSERYVRVTMRDYAFFVPTDCSGKAAVVEGVFRAVELPEAARQHLAEDGGEDPTAIEGSAVELTLIATAVDIKG